MLNIHAQCELDNFTFWCLIGLNPASITPPFVKSIPDKAQISQTLHINQLAKYQQIKSQRCQSCASRP